jgi:ESCRT-II complex subunit VPS36
MSLGIDDPVTRDAYKSSNEYFRQLARQLAEILDEPIKVRNENILSICF